MMQVSHTNLEDTYSYNRNVNLEKSPKSSQLTYFN